MEIQVIGKILSILMILCSGIVLTSGIAFFHKEKSADKIRIQLLFFSISAFIWAFGYGCIGFLSNINSAQFVRAMGFLGIIIFIFTDYCAVVDMAQINHTANVISKRVLAIVLSVDYILYSDKKVDSFVMVNGYMTWVGNETFARKFHMICFVSLAIVMGMLGVIAYRRYQYKRQKRFMVCFYIANLVMLSGTLLDTFLVLDYALPTAGVGAIGCTMILWIGIFKFNAFDASIGNVYDKIYNVINVGILIFDDKYRLVYVNPYGKRIIDISTILGKRLSDIFEIPEEKEKLFFATAQVGYSDGFHIKARETGIECNGRMNIVLDNYKEPYCYTMAFYDITKEINMLEELKAANATKEHFLTSMSHEIRTPINAIIGMNEMILRESKEKKVSEYAANIESSSGLLLSIVNDILDYSKIESGKLEVFNASYEIAGLINDSILVINKRAYDKEIRLEVSANPNLPSWLFGDEIRIRQIILNLLVNAVKYTDEGYISLECDFARLDEDNINLIFSVRDTGRGMKTTDKNVLFESFTRLDEKKNQTIEGTGLGLAITKSLLDLMGGTISVDSIYGVGSRFTVIIPQKISNAAVMGDISGRVGNINKQEVKHRSSLKDLNLTILAVDDVEMNLVVIKELLKETGIQVETATSGKEAIKKCHHIKYDMIFMDHMMPEMDGLECMNRIKSECAINRNAPFIVLTANAIVGARDKYIRDGFDDYLSKPLDGMKLEEMIKDHLKESEHE